MNGIQLIDALREDFPHIKFVVISGYSEFEYVQQAMLRKAVNYILKPIEEQALNHSLSLAIMEIRNSRLEREERRNLHMALNQSLPALKTQYLNQIVSEAGITGRQFQKFISELEIQFDDNNGFLIAVIHILNYEQLLNDKFSNDASLLHYSVDNIINQTCADNVEFMSSSSFTNKNEHIVMIGCSLHAPSPEQEINPQFILKAIINNLGTYLEAVACAGLGNVYEHIENMTDSYIEANHALKQLKAQKRPGVLTIEETRRKDKEPKDDIIGRVVDYLKTNFKEPITLESTAERFSLNSSYLSRLFKSECGENFIDYLTRIRIEKASRLMLNPHLKTYEIAEIVGYENTNYFSKVFKKNIGLSPTEYREKFIDTAD